MSLSWYIRRTLFGFLTGAVLLSAGHPAQTYGQTAEALALHAQRSLIRGLTYMRTGYPDKAVEAFSEGLRVNPDEAVLLSAMADAQKAAGDLASARFYAGRAVEQAPEQPLYLEQLADISRTAGDLQTAFDALTRLTAVDPTNLDARLTHADLLQRFGRTEDALRVARQAAAKFPASVDALSSLANLLELSGQSEALVQVLERLIELEPGSEFGYRLAIALERTGASQEAFSALVDHLVENPDDSRAMELLTTLSTRKDVTYEREHLPTSLATLIRESRSSPAGDSAAVYRKRWRADPENSDAAAGLARSLIRRNSIEEASQVITQQLERDPRRIELWIMALDALNRMERFDRAVRTGDEATLLFPGYAPIAYHYAMALAGKGNVEAALRTASQARETLDDSDPWAIRLNELISELTQPQ